MISRADVQGRRTSALASPLDGIDCRTLDKAIQRKVIDERHREGDHGHRGNQRLPEVDVAAKQLREDANAERLVRRGLHNRERVLVTVRELLAERKLSQESGPRNVGRPAQYDATTENYRFLDVCIRRRRRLEPTFDHEPRRSPSQSGISTSQANWLSATTNAHLPPMLDSVDYLHELDITLISV